MSGPVDVKTIDPLQVFNHIDATRGVIYGLKGRPVGNLSWFGYVKVGFRGKRYSAHRIIWESVHGPIPPGMQINHINGNKADNRIANLELVTPQQNCAHAYRTGLSTPRNGESNGQAKLVNEEVASIRARLAKGESQASIARSFNVHPSTISLISTGRKWRAV